MNTDAKFDEVLNGQLQINLRYLRNFDWSTQKTQKFVWVEKILFQSIWKKLTCASKNDMRSLVNFHLRTFKSPKISTFIWSFYPKYNIYEFKIYMGAMPWQKKMQNLTRNWPASSKLTWGIWQIFIQDNKTPKYLNLNGLLLTKLYNVRTGKDTKELCFMALNNNWKFERKQTYPSGNDKGNLLNFYQRRFQSLKIGTFIRFFHPK